MNSGALCRLPLLRHLINNHFKLERLQLRINWHQGTQAQKHTGKTCAQARFPITTPYGDAVVSSAAAVVSTAGGSPPPQPWIAKSPEKRGPTSRACGPLL